MKQKTAYDLFVEAWAEAIKDYDVGKYSKEIDQHIKIERLEKENTKLREALSWCAGHPYTGVRSFGDVPLVRKALGLNDSNVQEGK